MAFLNGKYTAFNPTINITGETPIFYAETAMFPYTQKFVVKGNFNTSRNYQYANEITHLIFDGEKARTFAFAAGNGMKVEEISFVNETAATWVNTIFRNPELVPLKKVNFTSVSDTWNFAPNEFQNFQQIEEINVFAGWNFDLTCLSEHLKIESIMNIIENIATVEETKSLTFAVTSQIPAEYIQMAINKGWTVS